MSRNGKSNCNELREFVDVNSEYRRIVRTYNLCEAMHIIQTHPNFADYIGIDSIEMRESRWTIADDTSRFRHKSRVFKIRQRYSRIKPN
jgi:hypothetical protein